MDGLDGLLAETEQGIFGPTRFQGRNADVGNSNGSSAIFNLTSFPTEVLNYYFYMTGNPVQTGPYTVILENEVMVAADRFSDILSNLGQVNSPINDFNIFQS